MDARLRQTVAVGRFGSFSKAADAVGVTQSAVTKSVADLERRLGYPIFHRTSRGVVPTDEGRVFLERALRLLTDAAELLGRGPQADPHSGTLRVGVFPSTIEWLLARPLEQLLARHPSIRLDITTGTKEHGLRMLEHGDVDVAISMEATFAGKPQFRCERITTVRASTFVRRGHPALAAQIQSPTELAPYPIILPAEVWDVSTLHYLSEVYGPERTDWFHKIENFMLACKVVEATDAIGVVDAIFADTSYFRERFCSLEIFPLPPTAVCCATRVQWTPKPAAAALIALLRQIHGAGPQSDLDNRLAAHSL